MRHLGTLLLEIYRLAQGAPASEFQTSVMDRLREILDFDSAFWATGSVEPGVGVTAHAYHLYHQPQEMMESWFRINQKDELAFEAFRQLGTTVNAELCGPQWQSRFSPEGRAHMQRYGMAHALSTITAEPVLQLWQGIGVYRADRERPFSEEARVAMQDVVPHLIQAWNMNRIGMVDPAREADRSASCGKAVCDALGVLYNADRSFADFMLREWPAWSGPRLPEELKQPLAAGAPFRHVGSRITIFGEGAQNLIRLRVRERTPVDALSVRERDVATLFANGESFRAIAENLHIAPVTVRNHLRNVYEKLGVTNKVELAKLMHER